MRNFLCKVIKSIFNPAINKFGLFMVLRYIVYTVDIGYSQAEQYSILKGFSLMFLKMRCVLGQEWNWVPS